MVRRERAQVLAHLVRLLRDVDAAEEVWADAVATAHEVWSRDGAPERPGAWLQTTAKNRALDVLRRENRVSDVHDQLAQQADATVAARDEGELFPDDRLRLIFTCCHPELPFEAQVALTLRLVCGLGTAEVARAFLIPETTLQQRIVRAKRLIADRALPYEVPEPEALAARLGAVLRVVHQVFNEGYAATSGDALTRVDLCDEALRLGELVVTLLPKAPEARGLFALMLLHASRAKARVDASGALVLLEDQDRSAWDQTLAAAGLAQLERAERFGAPGPFQLQAHIAACHARAARFEDTDWKRIVALYTALEVLAPSPVITLNRAVAVAMADGPEAGLALLERSAAVAALRDYHLLPATRADLLRRLGRTEEAAAEYQRALALVANAREKEFLERRLAALNVRRH